MFLITFYREFLFPSSPAYSSSPFPFDHFPISLSLTMQHPKQEPELWETKRQYRLPAKVPHAMRQCFNEQFR